MRKHLIQFLLVAVLLVFTSAAWAQTTVHGQLVDAETGEPLVGAAVMVEGTTQGSVTDIDTAISSKALLRMPHYFSNTSVIKTRRKRLHRKALP